VRTLMLMISGAILAVSLCSSGVRAEESLLPGKTGDYGRRYDVRTEETFTATVLRVHQVSYGRNAGGCVAAEVARDDNGRVDLVYLGPRSKWKRANLELREGRQLCLTGSRVEIEGRSLLLAKHVNDDQYWVRLRSDEGQHALAQSLKLPEEAAFVCTIAALDERP